jgi:hypothetical protein
MRFNGTIVAVFIIEKKIRLRVFAKQAKKGGHGERYGDRAQHGNQVRHRKRSGQSVRNRSIVIPGTLDSSLL